MKRYVEGEFIILLLYVDAMLIDGNGTEDSSPQEGIE
jgi:hypothetical protein